MAYDKTRKRWRVRKRIDGKWICRDFASRAEHDEWIVELRRGGRPESREMTFEEFAGKWLADYCRVEKAESQWKPDERTMKKYFLPQLGRLKLAEIRKAHLLDLKVELNRKGLLPKSVNYYLGFAKKLMATAVEWDLLPENPWAGVKPMKLVQRPFDFWTVPEFESFKARAEVIDPELTRIITLAFFTGLRAGEIAALTKRDIDFQRNQICVRATMGLQTGVRYERTKNGKVQWVPMNSAVAEALEPARFGEGPVFSSNYFWTLCRFFRRLAKKAGARPIRFHDLRHSFASNLAMAGVDLMVIQKLMRHASYQMTLRYAHLHPEHLLGITEVLCDPVTKKSPKFGTTAKK
jgi:integrase